MDIPFIGIMKIGYLAKATEELFSEERIVEQRQAASRLLDNTKRIALLAEGKNPVDVSGQVNNGMNVDTEGEKR